MKRLLIPLLAALALPNPLFADQHVGYEKEKECFSENGYDTCLLYTSPSPRDLQGSRMPSSA